MKKKVSMFVALALLGCVLAEAQKEQEEKKPLKECRRS